MYGRKNNQYFSNARSEIVQYLPSHVNTILEIGCGTGATLKYLKEIGRCEKTAGIEMVEHVADKARGNVDEVYCFDIESFDLKCLGKKFDVILLLDVLEHLKDPWVVLSKIVNEALLDGGIVIISLPNIRNIRVLCSLVLSGDFSYATEGIMDVTHLRFFTKKTAMRLVLDSGLSIDGLNYTGLQSNGKSGFLNKISMGLLKDFLGFQIIVSATKRVG